MALSPYAKLGYSTLRDLQMPQIPFELLDKTLSDIDTQADITEASLLKSPEYIRESESDRQLAEQINQYQQGIRDKLSEIARSGDTRGYISVLRQAQQRLYDIYRPGGAADILSQRVKQKQAVEKQIDDLYLKDAPHVAAALKKALLSELELGYNQQTGQFNKIGMPNAVRHVTPETINDFWNKNIDNLKDTAFRNADGSLVQGMTKEKLDAITTLYDFQDVKGVSKDRIRLAMYQILPEEYRQSIYQSEEAYRTLNLDLPALDRKEFVKDDQGNIQLNQNNPIGRMIEGLANIGARENISHTRKLDDNELYLEQFKSDLRKKEQEESTRNLIVRALPAGKPVPKDRKYYIRNGEIRQNTNVSADTKEKLADSMGWNIINPFGAMKVEAFFDRLFTKNDKVDINNTPELANLKAHMEAFDPNFNKLNNEDQITMLSKTLQDQAEGSIDARYEAGNARFKKNFDTIFTANTDKDGNILNVGNLVNFKFTDREGNLITGQKLAEKANKDKETISYKGAVTDVTSDLPYGTVVVAKGNDEVYMEPDIMTTYEPETLVNAAYRAMNNAEVGYISHVKYKGVDRTVMFTPEGVFKIKTGNDWETLVPVMQDNIIVGLDPQNK